MHHIYRIEIASKTSAFSGKKIWKNLETSLKQCMDYFANRIEKKQVYSFDFFLLYTSFVNIAFIMTPCLLQVLRTMERVEAIYSQIFSIKI